MLPVNLIRKLLIEVVKNAPKKETAMDRLAQRLIPKKEIKAEPPPGVSKLEPQNKMRVCPKCHKFRPQEEFKGRLSRCSSCKDT